MKQWFIQLENKEANVKITVYSDGTVYGTDKGNKLFIITEEALNQIYDIIKPNLYMLKTLGYFKENYNNIIIRINDTSRKNRNIKIVGWRYTKDIINILTNTQNRQNFFKSLA